jgi:hypothetical protein
VADPGRYASRSVTTPTSGAGPPIRLAFVGQGVYFRYCALETPTAGLDPVFIDYRAGEDPDRMMAKLEAFDPDVVLVFRPEIVPQRLFHHLRALRVGYLTEPLPRRKRGRHPDLAARLEYLQRIDPGNFDRFVSFDPLIAETVSGLTPIWRSMALPVVDRFFMEPEPSNHNVRILFTGRSTEHRERFLMDCKHYHDLVHIVHGVTDDELLHFLTTCQVGLNLHNEPYPNFENRVCVYLAAGRLLVTEPLSPTYGLVAGADYIEVDSPKQLLDVASQIERAPDAFHDIRLSGRRKAEQFRASRVYPELVDQLVADVEAFGRDRTSA